MKIYKLLVDSLKQIQMQEHIQIVFLYFFYKLKDMKVGITNKHNIIIMERFKKKKENCNHIQYCWFWKKKKKISS